MDGVQPADARGGGTSVNLVAGMVVRNELGRYLRWSLPALLEYADHVVILDDHSDDGTFEWLDGLEMHGRVRVVRSDLPPMFENEGAVRQHLHALTLALEPTHVIAVDADEFIGDGHVIRDRLNDHLVSRDRLRLHAWTCAMEEIWDVTSQELACRCDGSWRPHDVPVLYSVPDGMKTPGRWMWSDRALASGRVPQEVSSLALRRGAAPTGTEILHFGWADQRERQQRAARYAALDGGRFHANTHLQSILWPESRQSRGEREWPPALLPYRAQLVRHVNGTTGT